MMRLYRWILSLYPRTFRERFGAGMLETLRARSDAVRERRDRVGRAGFHLREVAGLLRGALRERVRAGVRGPGRGAAPTGGDIVRECRHAARRLVRTPGFTVPAVATVAVGIGAAAAVFTVVKAVVLDPLPYPESDRLVWLDHRAPGIGADDGGLLMTRGAYVFYRRESRTLEEAAIYRDGRATLGGEGAPERVVTAQVTPSFFTVLATPPALGRPFTEGDGYDGSGPAVILGHDLWRRRFGGDPAVLGRTIPIEDVAHEVVGIMPRNFGFPGSTTELWLPRILPEDPGFGGWVERGIGRMAPGVAPEDVERELTALVPRLPEAFPGGFARQSVEDAGIRPRIVPLKKHVVGDVESTLWILLAGAGLVLLVACANVANLFLVRATSRQRELGIRAALGAGRVALARVFLAESGLVVLMGAALGVAAAAAAVGVLPAAAPLDVPRLDEVALDRGVLAAVAGAVAAVTLIFGILPLAGGPARLVGSLAEGGRGSPGDTPRGALLQSVLVGVQVALVASLLVASGLVARSFVALTRVDPGFEADGVVTFQLDLPHARYRGTAAAATAHARLLERLSTLPGVIRAGAVRCLPLRADCGAGDPLYEEGRTYADGEIPSIVRRNLASPGYFRAMGIPLREGRTFEPADHRDPAGTVVVSAALAERFWPATDAVGRRINTSGAGEPWHTVVGVVESVRERGLEREPEMTVYYPLARPGSDVRAGDMYYALHSALPPETLVPAVRPEVVAFDPALPVARVATMEDLVARARAPATLAALLLGIAAAVTVILGVVGIAGVVTFTATRRRSEIGIRLALGARSADVTRGFVLRGGRPVLAGIVAGLAGAALGARGLEAILFEVSAVDPATYVGVAVTVGAVALAALWIPARRAAAVDPVRTLREE